jgi:hypothetical protein
MSEIPVTLPLGRARFVDQAGADRIPGRECDDRQRPYIDARPQSQQLDAKSEQLTFEHIKSALPPIATDTRTSKHFAFVPESDMAAVQYRSRIGTCAVSSLSAGLRSRLRGIAAVRARTREGYPT